MGVIITFIYENYHYDDNNHKNKKRVKKMSENNFDKINQKTGFANGDLFENEQEVRNYFTTENMLVMFNECDFSQEELNSMRAIVIENKWHMKQKSIFKPKGSFLDCPHCGSEDEFYIQDIRHIIRCDRCNYAIHIEEDLGDPNYCRITKKGFLP